MHLTNPLSPSQEWGLPSFAALPKLQAGDEVAILSPSFAAPARWPHVYELGLQRLRQVFGLQPIEFPTTKTLGAAHDDRARDLIAAFENPRIKAVISTLGGDDQVLYVKKLPGAPFAQHPKPFFGYSDNTHFMNHLWLHGVPSYYGGALFTEFAMQGSMDAFTVNYLKTALFGGGSTRLEVSAHFNDIGLPWEDANLLLQHRRYQENEGLYWDGNRPAQGITWGGCLESIDEMLRHNTPIPSLPAFGGVILFIETSEEIPPSGYVVRVLRAMGERGILERIQGLLVGRPKAWEFDKPRSDEEKALYKQQQREAVLDTVRRYNATAPVVQNLDFGHTAPQICLPMGQPLCINPGEREIRVQF